MSFLPTGIPRQPCADPQIPTPLETPLNHLTTSLADTFASLSPSDLGQSDDMAGESAGVQMAVRRDRNNEGIF